MKFKKIGNTVAGVCLGAPTSWIIYETIKHPVGEWVLSIAGFIGMTWFAIMAMENGKKDER